MDDLISRQAAIDEVLRMVNEHKGDRFGGELLHYTGVVAILDCLPSAQPEIVHCKDCKHWKNSHLCECLSRHGSFDTKENFYCGYAERRGAE